MPALIDLTGKTFGDLTCLSLARTVRYAGRNMVKYWLCRCTCGKQKEVLGCSLREGRTKSCGCSLFYNGEKNRNWKGVGELSSYYFGRIKRRAKRGGYELNFSINYLHDLYLKQNKKCALSGMDLVLLEDPRKSSRAKRTASLDRVDSSRGYEEGNVQWVHKEINSMKSNRTDQEFVEWCCKVADYQRSLQR